MKVLIGAPVHASKDYCMEDWIKNVTDLTRVTPSDVLIVDNSDGVSFIEKIKKYCNIHNLKNYKIEHFEAPLIEDRFERVARCREVIRKAVLDNSYDAWFSWECDQLVPSHALNKLIELLQLDNFSLAALNSWSREDNPVPNYDFGAALISRKALEKYSFILDFRKDVDIPKTWEPGENWFRQRIIRGGGKIIHADGIAQPIYHLDKGRSN